MLVWGRGEKHETNFTDGAAESASGSVDVVPALLPFDSNTVRPVTVEVHFLDPIPYEEYQGMKTTEIAEMVKKRIEAVVTA